MAFQRGLARLKVSLLASSHKFANSVTTLLALQEDDDFVTGKDVSNVSDLILVAGVAQVVSQGRFLDG